MQERLNLNFTVNLPRVFLFPLVSKMVPMEGDALTLFNFASIQSNGTCYSCSVLVAIDAMHSASNPHAFMGVTEQGLAAIVRTRGNQDVHVILRGGTRGPNFGSEHVKEAAKTIEKKKRSPSIMIDCSREQSYYFLYFSYRVPIFLDGNSQKNHNNQPLVIADICKQLASGERNITGVMIESNINEGRQDVPSDGPSLLKYGVSITDACVDFERTVEMLNMLDEVG